MGQAQTTTQRPQPQRTQQTGGKSRTPPKRKPDHEITKQNQNPNRNQNQNQIRGNKQTTPSSNYLFPHMNLSNENKKLMSILDKDHKDVSPFKRDVIQDGSVQTYETIFGSYMNANLRAIKIQEPYLNKDFQMFNLVRFLEVCLLNCPNLRLVKVDTKIGDNPEAQKSNFKEIFDSLQPRNIALVVEVISGIHDRSIVFDNGFVFDLGKGLHYFKRGSYSRFSVGNNEQRLKQCESFTLNISKF